MSTHDAPIQPGNLAIQGEMTIFTAMDMKSRLLDTLAGANEIEIDLSEVAEMDCAGLQLMIMTKQEAVAHGKTLRFVKHSAAVVEVLDLCDMSRFFGDPVVLPSQGVV